ncbi:MAG: hypothetical protein KatS3mg054_0395 [Chloroflexus sp.]|jgi:Zn-dependent peptidase ImmA (M78 family)/transcriptional regulator with XRE-family HTH domain|uniref:IrrE N-terminal-like domain-containing protein n=1 Tax=Chloroflexus aurantiacus (strain ATCC 29366 / DSM 635 / J-10-fl) TaxID=324602 RepID=A9WD61_CHLAA|nr:ImmA/IrrE family metallo-endopeptidase [Chloroflexus aurantiacus]GIV86366.1 MAG: hypothetical protein KatS3mg054_0395 [Chloroflexus sp.]ABY35028.1 protein of unknown function DUF955 [Chloroflexus aurantiacus J-10-fl]GIV92583.1 MAG: hypothetical protein KatS3mg056_1292 [Chloroflexus sp.]GIV95151.1 MAG: hypothetical protein KatS3mg056_3860 [Chloroflexus sp.]HBW68757.1 ImmA/IrrE family metallo-endopeptidase [Chloroflexus aurantiacus]
MKIQVAPALLRWACERAGFREEDLKGKFPRLDRWLNEEDQPTLKQLERFAQATHTPIGFFFLSEPPTEAIPIPDLRTVGNIRVSRPTPDLLDTIYLCQQRQEWYREFALIAGEPPLSFVGSVRVTDDVVATAERVRQALGFDLEERRQLSSWTDALRRFIEQADALGVLVMVNGVVGSNNRRKLNPAEFRGFALSDPLAPLIFINGADSKAAQMFTLAHELAHLWLGQSALSDVGPTTTPENDVEWWCNAVAAELLVPLAALRSELYSREELRHTLDRLSRQFKVSTLVILRRLYDVEYLTREQLWAEYEVEVDRLSRISAASGGNFYSTTAARVSKRFARAVAISVWEGRTSFSEASRLLGFKNMSTFREFSIQLGIVA